MTGEYINRAWLAQNVRMDMSTADVARVIENAPIVEFDPDEPPPPPEPRDDARAMEQVRRLRQKINGG